MATDKKKKCFVIGPIGAEKSPERTDADWLLQGIVKPALENDPFANCPSWIVYGARLKKEMGRPMAHG